LNNDDVLFSGSLASELDGGFDSLGARVPEEEGIERWVWHDWQEAFNKVEVALVKGDVGLAVNEGGALFGSCGADLGMAVAQVRDADTGTVR
jgi:hypothetical protein